MRTFRVADEPSWKLRFHRGQGRWILAPRWRPGPVLVLTEWALVTAAACAILMGALLFSLYSAIAEFDVASRDFADASIGAIDHAGALALARRSSPDFRASAARGLAPDLGRLRALGVPRANQGCTGFAAIEPWGVYSMVTARYTCEVRSSRGASVVALTLGRELLDWKITGLYIAPPVAIGR